MSKALEGRIALVTGASRGIGAAVAERFAAEGAHVIAVARTVGALEELDDRIKAAGGHATLVPLDLKDGDAIDHLGAAIFERWGRLDVLVGNAGVLGTITPVHHLSPKVFDDLFAINVRANWRLIRSCEPLLRASDAGRAVFLTDSRAGEPRAYWGLYGATKAGQEYLVRAWAADVATTRLRVNLFDPGIVATQLRAQAFPGEDATKLPRPGDVAPAIAALCGPGETRHGETVRAAPRG